MALLRPPCPSPDYLDIAAVADRLGLPVTAVEYLVRHQRIPYLRWGRRVGFDPARVDAWRRANAHLVAAIPNPPSDDPDTDGRSGAASKERM